MAAKFCKQRRVQHNSAPPSLLHYSETFLLKLAPPAESNSTRQRRYIPQRKNISRRLNRDQYRRRGQNMDVFLRQIVVSLLATLPTGIALSPCSHRRPSTDWYGVPDPTLTPSFQVQLFSWRSLFEDVDYLKRLFVAWLGYIVICYQYQSQFSLLTSCTDRTEHRRVAVLHCLWLSASRKMTV